MNKRSVYLVILLAVVFVFSSIAVSWADQTQCLVVRRISPSNTLWVSRVNNGSVGSFFQITGLFTSQPTVIWDEDTSRYYLYGTGLLGAVFRRTLDTNCNTVGGWVKLTSDGFSASPIGAAGGGRHQTFNAVQNNSSVALTSSRRNILTLRCTAPDDGFFLVRGNGTIQHSRASSSGNVFARVHISTVSGGTGIGGWTFTDLPSGSETGTTSFPYAIERWVITSGGAPTFYLTGEEGGTAAGTTATSAVYNSEACQYHPYAY